TVAVTVLAANRAPVVTAPASVYVEEDVASSIWGLQFSDEDADTSEVTVTLSVPTGSLSASPSDGVTVGGTASALTLTGSIADLNAFMASGAVTYTTAANATADVTLTVTINDNGNTGSGGAQSDTTSVTLLVTAVNDAPTVTAPASISVTEDVASALTDINFADVDAGSNIVTVTLSVPTGALTATSGGDGVTVTYTPTGVRLDGTIADLNAFIAGSNVTYYTAANATDDVTLTITVNDGGRNGIGGAQEDTTTVTLSVTPVNDAPVLADTDVVLVGVIEDAGQPS